MSDEQPAGLPGVPAGTAGDGGFAGVAGAPGIPGPVKDLPGDPGPATPEPGRHAPDRNLALELARVTEAGAMASARWVGRGDKNGADAAAVNAMRQLINTVSMNGLVVIGEGEKDHAPMLYNGEQVGDGSGPLCDVAVDPIDGTRLTANGMPNAISVIAVSARGSMYDPSAVYYMSKLVTGPEAANVVDIDAPPAANIAAVARAKNCSPSDVTVVMLDRPRHAELISEIRAAGARIKLLTDGDVAGAIMAARDGTGVDLLLGIGGTPEGIIAACAVKCLGGVILGKLAPRDDAERAKALDAGHDLDRVLSTDDLVASDDALAPVPSATSTASTSCGRCRNTRQSTTAATRHIGSAKPVRSNRHRAGDARRARLLRCHRRRLTDAGHSCTTG